MNYGLISNVGYHANQLTNNRILEEISDEENGIYSIEWGKGPSFTCSWCCFNMDTIPIQDKLEGVQMP